MHEKTKVWLKRISIGLAATIVILIVINTVFETQWMLFYDGSIRGTVVDAETRKPIDGAIVVGLWQLSQMPGEGFGGYAKIIVENTDKNGRFRLPFWVALKPWKWHSLLHELAPRIVIYKPGYTVHASHKLSRAGYPDHMFMVEEKRRELLEKNSIKPAKITKMDRDELVWTSYLKFRSKADYSKDYYSARKIHKVNSLIQSGAYSLPDGKSKTKILSDIKRDQRS